MATAQTYPRLGVVIVSYNSTDRTLEAVRSVLHSDYAGETRVVVVEIADIDQKSSLSHKTRGSIPSETAHSETRSRSELSTKLLELKHSNKFSITHIERDNRGFSASNNEGIKSLQEFDPAFYLLMNNDASIAPSTLTSIMKEVQSLPTSSVPRIYGPKIWFTAGMEYYRDEYAQQERGSVIWYAGGVFDSKNLLSWHRGVDEVDLGQFDRTEQTDFVTGCFLLIPSETWRKVGELEERYFMYLEDLDYSFRVKKAGGEVWYLGVGGVWHDNAGSSGGAGSRFHRYYQTRNRIAFALQHLGIRQKLAAIRLALRLCLKGSRIERKAASHALLSNFPRKRIEV